MLPPQCAKWLALIGFETLATSACAAIIAIIIVIIFILRNWKSWWALRIRKTFEFIDSDGKGKLSVHEVYSAVLYLHLQLPVYVPPPTKESVGITFNQLDLDASGTMESEEFDMFMLTITAATSLKVALMVVLQISSPLFAEFVYMLGRAQVESFGLLPSWVLCVGLLVENSLGWLVTLTFFFFLLSKRLSLTLADCLIHRSTWLVLSCFVKQEPTKNEISPRQVFWRNSSSSTSTSTIRSSAEVNLSAAEVEPITNYHLMQPPA